MVLGKAAEKASQTNFFLPSDENPGHKPKVLFVLRLNISLQRVSAFGPCNHALLLGSLEHLCLGPRGCAALGTAVPPSVQEEQACWKGWAKPCDLLAPLSRQKGLSMCGISKVLQPEFHWLVKKEERRGKGGSIANMHLFNLSQPMLTLSFFLGNTREGVRECSTSSCLVI